VVADWTALVQAGEGAALARDLIERHYDPRYAKSRARRPAPVMAQIDAGDLSSDDLDRMAHEIADQISSIRI
jgi:tRNA 2-selenouridine synthase